MFENVQFFSHLHFKNPRSAIMTQKFILFKNINMGIKKRIILCWFQIRWCRLSEMPLTKVKSKKPRKTHKNQNTQNSHSFLAYCRGICLKGQCHEIFDFWFFSWISFPQAPEYTIRSFQIFFKNSRRYSQLKICHRCQRHRWQMQKIFNHKSFNYLVWTPLGSIVIL